MSVVRILVCEPGCEPRIEEIEPTLDLLQKIVGGFFEVVRLDTCSDVRVDLYCNEDGLLSDLPFNRWVVATDGQQYKIMGAFFLIGSREGAECSLPDEVLATWQARLSLERN